MNAHVLEMINSFRRLSLDVFFFFFFFFFFLLKIKMFANLFYRLINLLTDPFFFFFCLICFKLFLFQILRHLRGYELV